MIILVLSYHFKRVDNTCFVIIYQEFDTTPKMTLALSKLIRSFWQSHETACFLFVTTYQEFNIPMMTLA